MESMSQTIRDLQVAAPLLPFPVSWSDTQGRLLGANQAWLDLLSCRDINDIVGQTPDYYCPQAVAQDIAAQIGLVVRTMTSKTSEEVSTELGGGRQHTLRLLRHPLFADDGSVCGVVSTAVDISAEREAAIQQENSQQLAALTRQTELSNIAHKVVHDLNSPLTALGIMLDACTELPDGKRIILKNTLTVLKDTTASLVSRISAGYGECVADEPRELILCSDFIAKCISERKYQYVTTPLEFDIQIAPNSQFSYIHAQSSQLARALANLISNASVALANTSAPKITVKLESDEQQVKITVADNGSGMPPTALENIRNRIRFTDSRKNRHGLGMMQVWDMVDANEARLEVCSVFGEGTTFELGFARQTRPDWIIEQLSLNSDDIVIILDDEQLVHDAWNLRLTTLPESVSDMVVRHEKQGQAVIDYVRSLCAEDRNRVSLFCDFELLNQDLHGLQVIEACKLERAVLVTGYYANAVVRKTVQDAGIQILPKQLMPVVPIYCVKYGQRIELSIPESPVQDFYSTVPAAPV